MLKFALFLVLFLGAAQGAAAQHSHGSTGPNGGPMEDVAGVHAELVTAGTTLTVNILDEDSRPVDTAGYSASVLVVNGASRETLKLAPAGGGVLKGEARTPLTANTQVTLMLKTAAGKSGQARFRIAR